VEKTWCRAQGHPGGVEPQTWVLSRGTNGLTVTSFGPKKVTIDLGVKILMVFWIPWFLDFVETRRSKIRGKTCEKKTFPQMFNRFSDLHGLFWWIFCIYISGGQPLKVTQAHLQKGGGSTKTHMVLSETCGCSSTTYWHDWYLLTNKISGYDWSSPQNPLKCHPLQLSL
jgi:hypothetical protein